MAKTLKRLFGGIDLNWKNLILFALTAGLYTGIMVLLPFTRNTSFRDIAVSLECWILFGIIIIANSKSPIDSALKCLTFFAISQPLSFLVQVPFNPMGFRLFMFFPTYLIAILLTAPLGLIGYYIKKKNVWSVLILAPMFILLAGLGVSYLRSAVNNFPNHLMSAISCFLIIVVVVIGIFDKRIWQILSFSLVGAFIAVYLTFFSGIKMYKVDIDLNDYGIALSENYCLPSYGGDQGNVEIVKNEYNKYVVRASGHRNGKYSFAVESEKGKKYYFRYSFDMFGNLAVNQTDQLDYI